MAVTAAMVKEIRQKTGAGMLDCKKALVETDGDLEKAIEWLRERGIAKAAKKAGRIAAEGLCRIKTEGNTAIIFELNSETDFVAKNEQFLGLLDNIGDILISNKPASAEEALKINVDGKTVEELLTEATATIGEKITLRRVLLVNKDDADNFGAYLHMGGKIAVLTVVEGANESVAKDVAMHVAAINPKYVNSDQVNAEELEKERRILKQEALNEGKPANIVEKMVEGRVRKYLKEICLVDQPFVKNPDETVGKFVSNNKGTVKSFDRLAVGEGIEKREENFAEEVMSQVRG